MAPGHDGRGRPAHFWNLDALAGAGAIRSTASDMLTYLDKQLHPETAGSLASAMRLSHQLHSEALPGMKIALAWLYVETGTYWHNGATGGYSSYVFFNPNEETAAFVPFQRKHWQEP